MHRLTRLPLLVLLGIVLCSCETTLKNTGPGFGDPGWVTSARPKTVEVGTDTKVEAPSPPVEVRVGKQIVVKRPAAVHLDGDWSDAPPAPGSASTYGLIEGFLDIVSILFTGK